MTVLARWRIQWTGFSGAPGVTTFYTDNTLAVDPGAAFRNFFNAFIAVLPTNTTITFPTSGDTIDDGSGALTGGVTSTGAAVVHGTGGAAYAAPAGIMVKWLTGQVVDGRRLAGKTYLVPLTSSVMDTDGTANSSQLTTIQTAASALVTALGGSMRAWHRPKKDDTGAIIRTGTSRTVVSATVPDRISILRSRRD